MSSTEYLLRTRPDLTASSPASSRSQEPMLVATPPADLAPSRPAAVVPSSFAGSTHEESVPQRARPFHSSTPGPEQPGGLQNANRSPQLRGKDQRNAGNGAVRKEPDGIVAAANVPARRGDMGEPPGPPTGRETAESSDPDPLHQARSLLANLVAEHIGDSVYVGTLEETLSDKIVSALENKLELKDKDPDPAELEALQKERKRISPLERTSRRATVLFRKKSALSQEASEDAKTILANYTSAVPLQEEQTEEPEGIEQQKYRLQRDYERQITAARTAIDDLHRQVEIAADARNRKAPKEAFGVSRQQDNATLYQETERAIQINAKNVQRIPQTEHDERTGELGGRRELGELTYGPVTVVTANGRLVDYQGITVNLHIDHPFGKQLPQELVVPPQDDTAVIRPTTIRIHMGAGDVTREIDFELDKSIKGDRVDYRVAYIPDITAFYGIPTIHMSQAMMLSQFAHMEKGALKNVLDTVLVKSAGDRIIENILPQQETKPESDPYAAAKTRLADFLGGGTTNSLRFDAVRKTLVAQEARLLEQLLQSSWAIDPELLAIARSNASLAASVAKNHGKEDRQARIYEYAADTFGKVFARYEKVAQGAVHSRRARENIRQLVNNIIATREAQKHLAELGITNNAARQQQEARREKPPQQESEETKRQKLFSNLYTKAEAHLRADKSQRRIGDAFYAEVSATSIFHGRRRHDIKLRAELDHERRIPEKPELTLEVKGRFWTTYDTGETFTFTYVSPAKYQELLREASRYQRVRGHVYDRRHAEEATSQDEQQTVAVILDGTGKLITGDKLNLVKTVIAHMPSPTE